MKKTFSLLLVTLLLLASLVGCGTDGGASKPTDVGGNDTSESVGDRNDGGNGDVNLPAGIDAVKLLLAEARLNSKLLQNEGDIFENGVQVMNTLANRAMEKLGGTVYTSDHGTSFATPLSATGTVMTKLDGRETDNNGSFGEEKQGIGTAEVVGDTVVWKDIGEVSNSYEYFLNLTNNIVNEADACAGLIDFVKKNIRIVDKWVEFGTDRYYLSVGENEELLCRMSEIGEGMTNLLLCHRYRNEAGKDVYEMYRDSNGFESRMTYIPGERYEISIGREQHFIATNTKGYWENYVLGDVGEHYNVSYLILKDDICYTFGFMNGDFLSVDVLSSDRQTDLFNYSPNAYQTTFLLKLNGFTNIEKYTAPASSVNFGSESGTTVSWDGGVKIHIKNGNVIEHNGTYVDGAVKIGGINIAHFYYGYGAEMLLQVEGTPEDALARFKQFLNETGLTCSRDIDAVLSGTKRALTDSQAVFQYYQWNGYTVNTKEGIKAATLVENEKYDSIRTYYENVKDAEHIVFDGAERESLEQYMSFAPITENVATGAKLQGIEITVEHIALTVDDVLLFVKDEPYHVALALADGNGTLIHLTQTAVGEVAYAGENRFSVAVSNLSLALPVLAQGSYRMVAYIATSDGIRSSEVADVSFTSAENLPVNLNHADINATIGEKGALTVTYTERNDVFVGIKSETPLAYADFKQLVCENAFCYGTPVEDLIEVNTADGYVPLTGEEAEIAPGQYRIAYTTENGAHQKSGYVIITYSIGSTEE